MIKSNLFDFFIINYLLRILHNFYHEFRSNYINKNNKAKKKVNISIKMQSYGEKKLKF